ncbi:DNA helicase MCM8-like [Xenia sp. Carnegie-2017]|uniref:DNA helicase MCM8-like n=1 Tax=Xenia sp. Carnegie-2017 TaxID=2897299 RepID=UPI001F04B4F1|nr:DNA helicase MCM8-like [Xenia sp. Carnegie-2017]
MRSTGSNSRGNFWRGRRRGFRGNAFRNRHDDNTSQFSNSVLSSQTQLRQTTLVNCPYKNWHTYFPNDAYVPNSSLDQQVHLFQNYFTSTKDLFSQDDIEMTRSLTVNFKELASHPGIIESLPNISEQLRDNPVKFLQSLSLAAYQVFVASYELPSQPSSQFLFGVSHIEARMKNYHPITPLKNLKANCYGKFIAIHGTVVRLSSIKPMVSHMAFMCNTCKEIQVLPLPDGKFKLPTKCESDTCRGRSFNPLESSPLTKTIDWQTIKVQEIIDDDERETGRIPRTVECELTSELVDSAVPGDIVKVCGIVKVADADENKGRSKEKSMFLLYILANSVEKSKDDQKISESDEIPAEFTLKELYAIREIQAEKDLFRLICGSLCPTIYGHEIIKAGLILGLFGGCQRFQNDKNSVPVRGNPHILVVGDPGLGKSQMLQAASNLAPRGVYVCGNTTSAAGLTVTLTKESSSGEYALEAGALVLADRGCCCIDEFDKMGSQHQALLEAMEQQCISIAKGGMVCSLPARTSILAAANPAGGHYNKAKTVAENLRMGSALLSRFDLVFIMLDKPDEEMDSMLSEHVMAFHSGKRATTPFETVTVRRNSENEIREENMRTQWEADKPLSERLKVVQGRELDAIPSILLRKYIAYARKYVHPIISDDAAEELQKFYINLRQQHRSQDSTPITTRQLESLIRLTEARSRLELREEATRQDAIDVIEIMKYSLVDTFSDGLGSLDFNRSQNGSGMSKNAQAKRFISELERISQLEYNSLFTMDQMRHIAMDLKLGVSGFEDFIYSLNNQNFLLKKGARVYQLQTSSTL